MDEVGTEMAGASLETETETEALETEALEVLRGVMDPELGDDIVSLGMVRSVRAGRGEDGSSPPALRVEVALTVASCPLRGQLRGDIERRLASLNTVGGVEVVMGVMDADQRSEL
ncbi:MAG: iron-sulfur cluster assembly protein, partial [Acidimicrobiales bacterium]